MLDMWTDFFQIMAFLSALLLFATFLRAKVKILQNFYVPNSIVAGLLGFILLSIFSKFEIFSITPKSFENYIYHLLGITFIALSLKKSESSKGKNALSTSFNFALGYGLQAVIGFGLALIVFYRFFPKFNPINGILAELAFSQSPSAAYTVALGWQKIILNDPNLGSTFLNESGIIYSTDVGLTFGAIGLLVAAVIGVILIKYGVKKGYTVFLKKDTKIESYVKKGYMKDDEKKLEAGKQTTLTEALDTLSLHIAFVFIIYIATYYLLKLFLFGIGFLPQKFSSLAQPVVSFHFIFGALLGMLARKIMVIFKMDFLLDDGIADRISGFGVDYMVAASMAAISIKVVINFIIPISVISAVIGIVTYLYCAYFGSRSFTNYKFERIVTIFGIATGTMASGMALLRVLDPDFKSPVASETLYGSGIAFFFAIPLISLINLQLEALKTMNNYLNWISLLIAVVYTILIVVIWRIINLLKFDKPIGKIFNIK